MVELKVFSRKSGQDILISISRIDSGWRISFGNIKGDSDAYGNDVLISCFDSQRINYPANLGDYLKVLHETSKTTSDFDVDLHNKLKVLGSWISKIETSTPSQAPFRMVR